jgi:hypothetical protein
VIYEIKKAAQDIEGESNKDVENLRKNQTNPGNKKFLKSNKKYSGKPLQLTRRSGGQNFRPQRQNRY